jgi:hypothetical protein
MSEPSPELMPASEVRVQPPALFEPTQRLSWNYRVNSGLWVQLERDQELEFPGINIAVDTSDSATIKLELPAPSSDITIGSNAALAVMTYDLNIRRQVNEAVASSQLLETMCTNVIRIMGHDDLGAASGASGRVVTCAKGRGRGA